MNKKHRKGYKKIVKENQEERKYSNALLRMIELYKPADEDWMGFKLTKNNPYT